MLKLNADHIFLVLYYVLTGRGERIDFGWFLTETSPYMWASIGVSQVIDFNNWPDDNETIMNEIPQRLA